jgi:cephalosporin-C deacetylase-like acetyl esterase
MQMARCGDRADPRCRAIVGVLKQFIHRMVFDENGTRLQQVSSISFTAETRVAETGGGFGGALTS